MKALKTPTLLGIVAAAFLGGAMASANAAGIERIYGENAMSPIAAGVSVPAGYTTYYISGALPKAITPAADGKPADYGDMATQTRSVLDGLKATMTKMGVGFGEIGRASCRERV